MHALIISIFHFIIISVLCENKYDFGNKITGFISVYIGSQWQRHVWK